MDAAAHLHRLFGHESFRPGQQEAVEAAFAGRDALVVMPTGSGKSLCYQLPGLSLDGLTIVISPLVALMRDQGDALAAAGHGAARVLNASLVESSSGRGAGTRVFLKAVGLDADIAQGAIGFVLDQPVISSALVDNLNASIHLRALLTDLFLIDQALKDAGKISS